MDLLSGLPVGLNALIFAAAHWIVSGQRLFLTGQSFVMIWTGFVVLSFSSGFLQWLVFGLIEMRWASLSSFIAGTIFGGALFPLVCVMLHLTHKLLPAPRGGLQMRS